MRVKWTAMTFGCVLGIFMFLTRLSEMDDLTVGSWFGSILSGLGFGVLMGLAYFYGQRLLHKHGYSGHEDGDFEDD
jgi:drug/metabolite transporter (DMT)-like permease